MKTNAFRTSLPTRRFQPLPTRRHATPRSEPRRKLTFRRRLTYWIVRYRDNVALGLAVAGVLYLVVRFALGYVVSKKLSEAIALGTITAVLMLVTALLLSIDSGRDNHRVK